MKRHEDEPPLARFGTWRKTSGVPKPGKEKEEKKKKKEKRKNKRSKVKCKMEYKAVTAMVGE